MKFLFQKSYEVETKDLLAFKAINNKQCLNLTYV